MKTPHELSGLVFGQLTAMHRVVIRQKSHWQCVCTCGGRVTVQAVNLLSGNTTSCGCARREACRLRERAKKHPTHGRVLSYYRRNARQRQLEWSLDLTFFTVLLQSDCYYCGAEPSLHVLAGRERVHNGIDRLDSKLGYVVGNVVSCCATCNRAKLCMSVAEFDAWIVRVARYRSLI